MNTDRKKQIKVEKTTRKDIKEFYDKEWCNVDVEHYDRKVQRTEWNSKRFIFKAMIKEETVGTITGKHLAGVVYIDSIIVAKKNRRQGVGRILMETVKEFGKKIGAHKVHLVTGRDWEANKFYEQLGFEKIGELPKHYLKHDFVIYSKFVV
ncbi:MAG: GNAT family N-acetyltransferase [bacterium]|nr:GNAT family N-acetyltransferase [bacterium]